MSIEFVELLHYLMYKTKRFRLACVCTVKDHRRRHSVERTKNHGTRLRLVPHFFFFPCYDVICDLLQYTRTLLRNLFVKYKFFYTFALQHFVHEIFQFEFFVLATYYVTICT